GVNAKLLIVTVRVAAEAAAIPSAKIPTQNNLESIVLIKAVRFLRDDSRMKNASSAWKAKIRVGPRLRQTQRHHSENHVRRVIVEAVRSRFVVLKKSVLHARREVGIQAFLYAHVHI